MKLNWKKTDLGTVAEINIKVGVVFVCVNRYRGDFMYEISFAGYLFLSGLTIREYVYKSEAEAKRAASKFVPDAIRLAKKLAACAKVPRK